jgi:hypothetical protein
VLRCSDVVTRAHAEMRARRPLGALALVDRGVTTGARCGAPASCVDELRYLRAEALRSAGRDRAAVSAFLALDRRGAPAAMRQNALYAAGQLELDKGSPRAALRAFQRALEVAPRGALREESLLGVMSAAERAGDRRTLRETARRYLASFPDGHGAARARQLAGN